MLRGRGRYDAFHCQAVFTSICDHQGKDLKRWTLENRRNETVVCTVPKKIILMEIARKICVLNALARQILRETQGERERENILKWLKGCKELCSILPEKGETNDKQHAY